MDSLILAHVFYRDSAYIYRARPFDQFEWLEHGFGTRRTTAWSGDPRLTTVRQVHSDVCLYADGRNGVIGEGDALMTDRPHALLAVRTADCLPVLLVDGKRRVIAAAHAGWRGTVRGVAAKTVRAMAERFAARPEDLLVAIGPGIGPCCYEVGPEVAAQFRDILPENRDLAGSARINLVEANRRQLLAAGVPENQIAAASRCTSCFPDEFYSWRRDRQRTGRMLSAIRILV